MPPESSLEHRRKMTAASRQSVYNVIALASLAIVLAVTGYSALTGFEVLSINSAVALLAGPVFMLAVGPVREQPVPESKRTIRVLAGAGAGASAGATLGSLILPGVGTAIGAVGGTLLGGALAIVATSPAPPKCRVCNQLHHNYYENAYCPNVDGYSWHPNEVSLENLDFVSQFDVEVYIGVHFDQRKGEAKILAKQVFRLARNEKKTSDYPSKGADPNCGVS